MSDAPSIVVDQPARPAPARSPPVSTTSRVFAELRRRIIIGELTPGEKLKIEDLRAHLDAGATPIREALSLLTSDQLVERIDQRGFRVAEVSEAQFQDILRTRCWLEERALRESIAAGDRVWEEELVLAHHRLSRKSRTPTDDPEAPDTWEALHKRFHMALIAASGSPILQRFCALLYDQNVRYRYLAVHSVDYASRDVAHEHAGILAAAIDRDADLAVARLLAHYRRTGSFLGSTFG
jgi:GntR family carbon starvation induced transcriptional regulator